MTASIRLPRSRLAGRAALLACFLALSSMSKAHAGPLARQAWTVPQGKPTILASYYEIQESNCMALRAPPVILKTRPAQGSLSLNKTFMLAENPPQCRHVRVPVTQVIYQAHRAVGTSQAAWDVHFQSRSLGTRQIAGTITVKPGKP
jgi:hypothetical protein